MKRLLPFLSIFFCLAVQAFPEPVRGVYNIDRDEDLKGGYIHLVKGATLLLRGGTLRNGTLRGDGCRVLVESSGPVFDNVLLDGTWSGSLADSAFVYREGEDHYRIIASLFRFNEVEITRPSYRIGTWYPIPVNPESQVVHGNGVTLQVTKDKGEWKNSDWGRGYTREMLFYAPFLEEGNRYYEYNDISLADESDVRDFILYSYFSIAGKQVHFNRVRSDGAGSLYKLYNIQVPIDELCFQACSSRTNQFAIEVLNVDWKSSNARTRKIVVDRCEFYQYGAQKFVGLLSVAGTVPTDTLRIKASRFDGTEKAGNLEVTLARYVEVTECEFVNQFLQSEPETRIELYVARNNVFRFTTHRGTQGYSLGGKVVRFQSNKLIFEDKMTKIRVIGPVQEFGERNNLYYLEKNGRRSKSKEKPFISSSSRSLPSWLFELLGPLYYRS